MEIDKYESVTELNPDPLLTMREAANYLGISRSKMYEIAETGQIRVVRVTADAKVRRSALEQFIASRETTWRWGWGIQPHSGGGFR